MITEKYRGLKKNATSWEVRLTIRGKKTYLGSFKDIKDALFCYNAAEKLYYPNRKPQVYNSLVVGFSGNIGGVYG